MHNIIISDTSCLIIFSKIGQLEILQKVYDNVITTPEVAEEFSEDLPDWII
jgi:predicted nucleic acid-binding protein